MTSITSADRFGGGGKPKPKLNRNNLVVARQVHMDAFIKKLRTEQDKHHKLAVKRNQKKIAKQLKKNRLKRGTHHHSIFEKIGDGIKKGIGGLIHDVEKSNKKFVEKLKPIAIDTGKVLNWAIDHSDDIADGMAITGGILTVVAGGVAATGIGLPVAAGIESVAVSLEAGAPVVRNQGRRAKKIRDIALKIKALIDLIKTSKSTKTRMIAVADILEQASKINNDKDILKASKLIKDTIVTMNNSIKHAELLLEAVKKGDLIAGVRASIELGKDVKKGKKILKSGKELFLKAKAFLSPKATKQREKDAKEKAEKEKKRIAEGGETRTQLNKHLKSELFAMAELRGLIPNPRLLKADLITLLLNNPKAKDIQLIIPPLPTGKPAEAGEPELVIPPLPDLPERKIKKKAHRKPSKYNLFVGERIKEGHTFLEAVALWNAQKNK